MERTVDTATALELAGAIDFDLHGLVRVRLLGAGARELRQITRQLGPIQAPARGDPDIIIRYVDSLAPEGRLRLLGAAEAGYTDDVFLVLRGKQKSKVRVQIPFDQIGAQVEIVCQRGAPAVPLLMPVLNLTALARGALPLHASAFTHEGQGILATGWAKGGKTESLLAFVAQGAQYIGDEWIYLRDGHMWGIPEPIRVWDWFLDSMPQLRARVAGKARVRLAALRGAVRALVLLGGRTMSPGWPGARLARRVLPFVERQQYTHLRPHEFFGSQTGALQATVDHLFLVASHASDEIVTRPIDVKDVAARMVFSLQDERRDFMSFYHMYRFAFPDRRSDLVEQAEVVQRRLLDQALKGIEAHIVYHPYPVHIPALYDAMQPLLSA